MYVTAKLLRSWGACWDDRRIAEHALAAGASPRQIAADESISLDDRLWVLTRCIWHLDESAARYYAIERARTVTHLAGDEDDQAQYEAILSELCRIEHDVPIDQRDAARAAARAAAWATARDAARDAAWAADRDAAWAADRAAARAAARAADRDAAWDAAMRESIAAALEWLGDEAGEVA
jgi:hypothetical protein